MRNGWRAAGLLSLGLLGAAPAQAYDIRDVQYFRATGYRSCQKCDLAEANLQGARLGRANLQGARLDEANLQKANLIWANLQGARLTWANFQGARLDGANLQKANLVSANLQGARLGRANLREAVLVGTNLQEADLGGANLQEANLGRAKVANAQVSYVNLTNAIYAPASPPPNGYVAGIQGLRLVVIPTSGDIIGLVQLRKLLQEAGLPEEREATYAIEHSQTRRLLWRNSEPEQLRWNNPRTFAGGIFRWLAFELPVGYGLYPGRALLVLFIATGAFGLVYTIALATETGSIYRVWPAGRLELLSGDTGLAEKAKAEPLHLWRSWAALGRGLQFSLLSAFHIGFRELNVGNWLARVQAREYGLQAVGWVRVVAGLQSLLSVYLLAMWVLTYFGRPFG